MNFNTELSNQEISSSILDSVIIRIESNSIFLLCICCILFLIICLMLYRHVRVGRGVLMLSRELKDLQQVTAQVAQDERPSHLLHPPA